MKKCKRCTVKKSSASFHKGKDKDGLHTWCKECTIKRARERREEKTGKAVKPYICSAGARPKVLACTTCANEKPFNSFNFVVNKNAAYGITGECKLCCGVRIKKRFSTCGEVAAIVGNRDIVEALIAYRNAGACDVCASTERLTIDHCHATKILRGILCAKCNTALGMMDDDPDLIQGLIDYLKEEKTPLIQRVTSC